MNSYHELVNRIATIGIDDPIVNDLSGCSEIINWPMTSGVRCMVWQ